MSMVKPVESVTRYLRYAMKARSGFGIHSPFVFGFYNKVLLNGEELPEYRQVEKIRRDLTSFTRFIKRNDLGAKAGDFSCDHRFARVKDVVRRSAVSPRNGQFLFRLVRETRPLTLLEFGTSLGISTMYLSLAAPKSRIITMEGCIDSAGLARENFDRAGLNNIKILHGNFEHTLDEALAALHALDFVFFDGNHRYASTMHYFESCMKHITPRSVFVFDDIHWSPEMEKAWTAIRLHPAVKVTIDLYQMGVVFFRTELSKEDFILRY